ncbi:hypothetical protein CAOG_05146 [Capsaspora owczarzaki ATCC 30864]|uniref:Uncharacterized protein n=1 Tax=Capsaspora owczarzaki (strain ATCC 30864) TaxID=595528 RepID=A0A0D2WSQ0_CAPO3|nr:hypothetical protein CAOG_05146 [Capsaspora owczarzaki ATCC 30864]KJE94513.1 hypothetical protein CAOG_005146 [Capsaspora owczarzaki ATCC 30864]|eukprot:XP_004346831.1 hypothetical protein CAOG_05146 [Capsaspora owczarzaki ATCC 30864]
MQPTTDNVAFGIAIYVPPTEWRFTLDHAPSDVPSLQNAQMMQRRTSALKIRLVASYKGSITLPGGRFDVPPELRARADRPESLFAPAFVAAAAQQLNAEWREEVDHQSPGLFAGADCACGTLTDRQACLYFVKFFDEREYSPDALTRGSNSIIEILANGLFPLYQQSAGTKFTDSFCTIADKMVEASVQGIGSALGSVLIPRLAQNPVDHSWVTHHLPHYVDPSLPYVAPRNPRHRIPNCLRRGDFQVPAFVIERYAPRPSTHSAASHPPQPHPPQQYQPQQHPLQHYPPQHHQPQQHSQPQQSQQQSQQRPQQHQPQRYPPQSQ